MLGGWALLSPTPTLWPPPTLTGRRGLCGGVGLLLAHVGQGSAAVAVLPATRGLRADHATVLLTWVVRLICGKGRVPAPQERETHTLAPRGLRTSCSLGNSASWRCPVLRSGCPHWAPQGPHCFLTWAHSILNPHPATGTSPTQPPWPACWSLGTLMPVAEGSEQGPKPSPLPKALRKGHQVLVHTKGLPGLVGPSSG